MDSKVARARWVVLVTDPMAEEGLELLRREPEIDLRVRTDAKGEALRAELADADALLVRSGTRVTADLLTSASRLRVVGRAGTGVDNIDVAEATRRGVVVMNTPGGNSLAACEHTFALLLSLLRNVPAASADLAQGKWNRSRFMGRQLAGKTLGLVGFGRIGKEVAVRARAFGMSVLVSDPFTTESVVREWDARLVPLAELLERSDVVSLHLPLTEETRHLIDARALASMKEGALLANCARGGLVDEDALLAALDAGRPGGAVLDVFEEEPPKNLRLLGHPRVVCTPHLGASTEEAQRSVAAEIADQVLAYLLRGEVRNAVNMPALSAEVYAQVRPYLDLGERLGSLAGQVAGDPATRVLVTFRGACRDLPRVPLVSSVLVGLLGSRGGGSVVNYVNALPVASEIGMAVEEAAVEDAGDHAGLLEVTVLGSERSSTVAGVVTSGGRPRLARWEGLGLDAPATGDLLVLRNPDVPGVVGMIGTLLGNAGLNIAHIAWGRDEASREAFTLIHLDSAVPPGVLEEIRGNERIFWAAAVKLP